MRGTISDANGETLISATVQLKEDPSKGALSDFDGKYSLKIESSTPVTLVYKFVGLQTKEITVNPQGGEVLVKNVTLASNVELKAFEVKAKLKRDGDLYLERLQQKSPTSISVIGKETMKATGDGNAAAAMKRISGVSTVGKYVTVRGLADRYLVSTINGARIPTLDPVTNNLKMDIFPTGLIDNVVITKSGSPNYPGDWSGAFISINTADFPEQLQVNVSSSVGYNTNSTFNDILISKESDADWRGVDGGLRALPDGIPDNYEASLNFPERVDYSLFGHMQYLGLGPYLSSIGVTDNTNFIQGNPYYLLSMVQLGLLQPYYFNDPVAQQSAISQFQSNFNPNEYTQFANQDLQNQALKFDHSNMFFTEKTAPLDFTQSLSIGNQIELFGKPLGFYFGLRYTRRHQTDTNSVLQRTFQTNFDQIGSIDDADPSDRDYEQTVSRVSYGWNALANVSYKLGKKEFHRIGLRYMPNQVGTNQARAYTGETNASSSSGLDGGDNHFYESRRQDIYQFNSDHYFPSTKLKVSLDGSFTDGFRNTPDMKELMYDIDPATGIVQWADNSRILRRYRTLNEDILDTRLNFELPLDSTSFKRNIQFGAAYLFSERSFNQVSYILANQGGGAVTPDYFATENFLWPDDRLAPDLVYENFNNIEDNDIGQRSVYAGYLMSDYQISPRSRVIAGVRAEIFEQFTDIQQFHEDGIAENDTVARTVGAGAAARFFGRSGLEDVAVLPSVNYVYKLKDAEKSLMNLRFSAFLSTARPSIREASAVGLFDFELQAPLAGNPNLVPTDIQNLEVRWETFLRSGSNFSVSAFYKNFTNHIEFYAQGLGFSWQNADQSYAQGLEFEGKWKLAQTGLLKNFTFRGNVSLIDSETRFKTSTVLAGVERIAEDRRDMFGQAPYILNGILTYRADSIGLSVSASFNRQGDKLSVAAEIGTGERSFFDVYERSRNQVDLTITKKLGKHFTITGRIRNLLDDPYLRSYDYGDFYALEFDRFNWGTDYRLGVSYRLTK